MRIKPEKGALCQIVDGPQCGKSVYVSGDFREGDELRSTVTYVEYPSGTGNFRARVEIGN